MDLEAKKAAEGLTSDKHTLPCFLRCNLTINPSTIKQNMMQTSKINGNWTGAAPTEERS